MGEGRVSHVIYEVTITMAMVAQGMSYSSPQSELCLPETLARGRVGILGHRGWIAQQLMASLNDPSRDVVICPKSEVLEADYSSIDCIYLFAGRAKGTAADNAAELALVERLSLLPRERHPRRLVYVSSRAASRYRVDYGRTKWDCEGLLLKSFGDVLRIVRPGAVFGTTQPIDSPMLVPSLAREGLDLDIRLPHATAVYIPVYELVDYLLCFADLEWDGRLDPYFDSSSLNDPWHIPGSFTATADQLRALWQTWDRYRQIGTVI